MLASDLGINDVLDTLQNQFNLEGVLRGKEYVISCPNPDHDDTNPSCSVNISTGLFHCFSCNFSGDLLTLGHLILGWPLNQAKKNLQPDPKQMILNKIISLSCKQKSSSQILELSVPDFPSYYQDEPLDFMYKRGFTEKTMRDWGVQFCPEETLVNKQGKEFAIHNCIAIPLRDYRGLMKGWIYRKTDDSMPKYIYTPNLPIGDYWFGAGNLTEGRITHPIIVEGSLDVMWLHQAGFRALGMLGSNADSKLHFLYQFSRVYLLPDRDEAGVKWKNDVATKLSKYSNVYLMRYPSNSDWTDPQEVPEQALKEMYLNARHFLTLQKSLT